MLKDPLEKTHIAVFNTLFNKDYFSSGITTFKILYTTPDENFYNDLIYLFSKQLEENDFQSDALFFNDLKANIIHLSSYFNKILSSGFYSLDIDKFLIQLKKILKYNLSNICNINILLMFWFELTLPIKNEIQSTNKNAMLYEYSRLLLNLKNLAESKE